MIQIVQRILEVKSAEYLTGYQIRLTFNDGAEQIVNFEPFLMKAKNPMITKYRDLNKFKAFRIEYGDLVWNDYDLCFPIQSLYEGEI